MKTFSILASSVGVLVAHAIKPGGDVPAAVALHGIGSGTSGSSSLPNECEEDSVCRAKDPTKPYCNKNDKLGKACGRAKLDTVTRTNTPSNYPTGQCVCANTHSTNKYRLGEYARWLYRYPEDDLTTDVKQHPAYGTPEDLEPGFDRAYGRFNGIANYGEYCNAHDRGVGAACDGSNKTDPMAAWCKTSWCYLMPDPAFTNAWKNGTLDTSKPYRDQLVTYTSANGTSPEYLNLAVYCQNGGCATTDNCGPAGEENFESFAEGMINPLKQGRLVWSYGMCPYIWPAQTR